MSLNNIANAVRPRKAGAATTCGRCVPALVVFLVACAGPQYGGANVQHLLGSPILQGNAPHSTSGFRSDIGGTKLLYVSESHGNLYVFSYPKIQLVGEISGFSQLDGLCVDRTGDVFVPDFGSGNIFEYPHGRAAPAAVLEEGSGPEPVDCDVDPTTGNVAVANYNAPGGANIAIFPHLPRADRVNPPEWGKPRIIADPQITIEAACGFDASGNLYIDGYNGSLQFAFAELPAGARSFVNVTLPNKIKTYGAIRWDGSSLSLADYVAGVIYRINVVGSSATIRGETRLEGSDGIAAYSFDRSNNARVAIVPNFNTVTVGTWAYPNGGPPLESLQIFGQPEGAVVSEDK